MNTLLRWFASGPDAPPLRDARETDRLYVRYRWAVMLSITVGYGIAYTCRLGLSVVKKDLIDADIFTAAELGIIGSGWAVAYAFGKLVNGFLADHANLKKFWPTGVLLSALINIAMGWSAWLWAWVALWAVNAWFQGFGAPAGIVALSQWFSNRERGTYYGVWSTAHSVGEGLTFIGSSALVVWLGWRGGLVGPGTICVVVALLLFVFMKDRPQTLGLPSVADWKNDHGAQLSPSSSRTTWQMQFSILRMPAVWVLAFACATMTMTRYAMNSWGMLYLQETKGYSTLGAGGLLALNPLAGIAGCVLFGLASDKLFGSRRPPMNLICGLVELLALGIMFFSPPGHPLLLVLAFLLYGLSINGLITSLGGLFGADIVPKKAVGAVMGFIGVFSYCGVAVQERISGWLIQRGTTFVEGVRHYDFSAAVAFWLGASVVSLILATSLWRVKVSD